MLLIFTIVQTQQLQLREILGLDVTFSGPV